MANYCGTGRSNYFKVKDKKEFLEWLILWENVRHVEKDGLFAVFGDEESGDFPVTDEGLEFVADIATQLTDDTVAIFMQAGAEKERYITGYAFAINSKGQTQQLALNDIYYMVIANLISNPEHMTSAEY